MSTPEGRDAADLRRWLVVGAGGAGKTTFSLELARILDLPLIHLDRHFWRPGWVQPPDPVWDEQVAALSGGDAWVMDGHYSRTLEARLTRAQAAVLLDPPTLQCLGGVLRRSLVRRARARPDLAEGCDERLPTIEFLRYVATYKWRSRPKVLRRIAAAPHVRFYHLRSRAEAARFLSGLRAGR